MSPQDDAAFTGSGWNSPAVKAFAITPDDSADLARLTRAIYVGVTGNISLILKGDDAAVTFVGVPAGTILPLRVTRVRSTGTTATDLVGLH